MTLDQLHPAFGPLLQAKPGDCFYDGLDPCFSRHGLLAGQYARLPEALWLNEHLARLSRQTAGGRIRFATDAAYIHICVTLGREGFMAHMPLTGSSGVDVFLEDQRYVSTLRPLCGPQGKELRYGTTLELPGEGLRTVTLYLPLYDEVAGIQIGLPQGAAVAGPRGYAWAAPLAFYGSSITQGGCACRSSGGHCALLARFLDADFINLGFSGNAKGEAPLAEHIAGMELSAFILDYDHNAPDVAHLASTHEAFFKIIRKAQPTLPILLLSSPNSDTLKDAAQRREVIRATYDRARACGDAHVYFVPGEILLGETHRDCCRVDASHPNDLGFMRMAEAILPTLRCALEQRVK